MVARSRENIPQPLSYVLRIILGSQEEIEVSHARAIKRFTRDGQLEIRSYRISIRCYRRSYSGTKVRRGFSASSSKESADVMPVRKLH